MSLLLNPVLGVSGMEQRAARQAAPGGHLNRRGGVPRNQVQHLATLHPLHPQAQLDDHFAAPHVTRVPLIGMGGNVPDRSLGFLVVCRHRYVVPAPWGEPSLIVTYTAHKDNGYGA